MTRASWRLLAETMEARILHSADLAALAGVGWAALHDPADGTAAAPVATPLAEIAFVDASLPDAQGLLADLQAQRSAGRRIEIVSIDSGADGLALVGDTLAGRHDIGAVHLLAHGSDGRLQLGSAVLDGQTLLQRAGELAAWGQALSADADLLLYGCDLAQGATGQRLVQDLAALTGADVAASTDLTGAAARGGNWRLEFQSGAIESALAPSGTEQAQWQGLLATYTVTNTADFVGAALTPGTLRWAISQANANAGTDSIVFAVNGTINLMALLSGDDNNASGDFDIKGNLNLVGNGSANTVINGNGQDRVFDLRSGSVSLSGLTIQGGASKQGAGVRVGSSAGLTLTDAVVRNNAGNGDDSKGGGIYADGVLVLKRVLVQGNGDMGSDKTDGAGIYATSGAKLDIRDVEIRDNLAGSDRDGGGLYIDNGGQVTLENVTLAGNQARRGGGIFNHDNATSLTNVTLSGNTASSAGGGLWTDKTIALDHVSVAFNSAAAGGGVFDNVGNLRTTNSLFAGNGGGNANRALSSLGYNLSDDNSAGFAAVGDRNNVAAGAAALAANGGFARTVAIGAGSAARDAANPATSLSADERGTVYAGGRADIGAFEYNPTGFAPTISAVANQTIAEDNALAPLAFTIGDAETAAGSLVVTVTSSNPALVPNASIVLGGAGANRTVGLTPAANANSSANGGSATITLSVSDGGNVVSTSFDVTVQARNDAPTVTLPGPQSVDEGSALVFAGASAISVSDIDAGAAALQVTLTVADGKLDLSQTAGLAFVVGNGLDDATMTFIGRLANVNAAMDGLRYKPADGYEGPDQLDIAVNDLGNSGSGGAASASASVAITVAAVNDAPLLTLPGAQSTPLPAALAISAASGNAITVSDPDPGALPLQLTLSTANALANGTLSFGSLAGLTVLSGSGTNDTTVVLRGSASDLNAALDTLSFTATAAGPARIDVSLDDLGNSGSGGALQVSGAVAITVGNNALPVLTLGSATATFTEGAGAITLDAALTLSDADHATLASAQVAIVAGYAGAEDLLAFSNDGSTMGNIAGSVNAGVLTLASAGQTATVAEWQQALRSVSYNNASTAPNTGARTLNLTVNDGVADSATRQIALTVVAVNDAPVLVGANDLGPVAEDSAGSGGTLVSALLAGHLGDADSPALSGIAVIGADNTHGSWQYTRDSGTTWNAFGAVDASTARLLAADAATSVRFVPAADWNGTVAGGLSLRGWDRSTGSAGALADTSSNGGSTAFSAGTASSSITVTPVNDAPVLAGAIADQPATQGVLFGFTLPPASFTDVDAGDTLSYAATLSSGAALPSWLNFNAATRSFSGTPANVDVGAISVHVVASDVSGTSASDDFTLTVANVNDAPLLALAIADQSATQDLAFSFAVPASSFDDIDAGDTLAHTATLASGAALPAWLGFDAATQVFSGTPAGADVGTITLRVVATDGSGATASDDFLLTVSAVNHAPALALPIADQPASQGLAFGFTLPAATFTDVDAGDTLSYSATLDSGAPLPSWLNFDAATRAFSGTPANADVGTVTLRVTATDGSGASASDDFTLTVANVNDAPLLARPIADQSATQGLAFGFALPPATFSDIDAGDTLRYSATLASGAALPAWLSFDAATRSFSGTPANADVGALALRVVATDRSGASASGGFTLTVADANDAPTLAQAIADRSILRGTAFAYTLPAGSFSDPDAGDTLSYTATQGSGAALPAWLGFDAATRTFSGTASAADIGTVTLRVVATDRSGASASGGFTLTVVESNAAPLLARPIADASASQDSPFAFALPAGTFTDADAGDTLNYTATLASGAALPSWLAFDATRGSFVGTPGNADVGTITLRVVATDRSGASASDDFSLTVANVNDAPTRTQAIADQSVLQGSRYAFALPPGAFSDSDAGDTLHYSATLASGAALPSWLVFDAATRGFSGTPGNADVGTITLRVVATDGSGASASDDFALSVVDVNDAPVLARPLADQALTAGTSARLELPAQTFADADSQDRLSLQASQADGSALPGWLQFDAAHQVFTASPQAGDVGALVVRVLATDSAGATVPALFTVTVAAAPAAAQRPIEPAAPAAAEAAPAAAAAATPAAPATATAAAAVAAPATPRVAQAAPNMIAAAPVADALLPAKAPEAVIDTARHERPREAIAIVPASFPLSSRADSALGAALLPQYADLKAAPLTQWLRGDDLLRKLDELQQQMSETGDARRSVMASSLTVTGGLSIGYVVWLVRGGVLASSMLSALPAWQMIDPLPVLAAGGASRRRRGDTPADEPEVERLFDGHRRDTERGAPAALEPAAPAPPTDPVSRHTKPKEPQR